MPRSGQRAVLCVLLALGAIQHSLAQPANTVRTVDAVDLDRYTGVWFEVARFPNRFQNRCVSDVRARYTRRPDGRIDVVNSCLTEEGLIDATGSAKVVDRTSQAKLKVRFAPVVLSFLPFVWGDYWIIGLDDAYRWAVVGSPDRKYLWVLARQAAVRDDDFNTALEMARRNGFDTTRLVRTRHGLLTEGGPEGPPLRTIRPSSFASRRGPSPRR